MSMEKQVRAILAAQIGLHNTVYVVFMLRLTSLCISIYLCISVCAIRVRVVYCSISSQCALQSVVFALSVSVGFKSCCV